MTLILKRSERNKINRASSKGGALHTTGRKAHHEIALDISSKLGRAVYPDELFVATHKKKTGDWVDRRSEKTHAEYHENLAKVIQTDGGATRDTQEVDGSQRIQIWKDVSKGKSRGRCYGTGHLAKNLKYKNLIYEAEAPHNRAENQIIEAARAEAAAARADAEAARAEVAAARADADAARAEAAASTARTRSLEIKFEEFQSRMMALETTSCSGHSRQSSHPHYDNELDDQSVDEEEDA
ncbi:uncharacterized protein LOC123922577 [Trifolium pratense]|nr:uncharacterized protein LOC123922577 [Trifolium pratense]